MRKQVRYNGWADRSAKAKVQEAIGLRMIQDHFEPGFDRRNMVGHWLYPDSTDRLNRTWVEGEAPRGVMTFTDESEETVS